MSDMSKVTADTSKLLVQLEQLGLVNLNASKSMGLYEKQMAKLDATMRASPLNAMITTVRAWGKATKNVIKITGLNTTMTEKGKEEHRENMSTLQKYTAAVISHGLAQKLSNKMLKVSNGLFSRLLISVFSLVSIFLIVGFALAALSIAFEGANSPLINLTEDMGIIGDAMQGLVLIISGEGDEGGLSTGFDILAAAMFTASIAALALGTNMGILVGVLMLAIGVYRMVASATNDTEVALAVAISVVVALTGAFIYLKAAALATALGMQLVVVQTVALMMMAYGLIIIGTLGLIEFATGTAEGWKAGLLAAGSAFLIFIGILLLGIGWPVAAAIAAFALIIALVYRFWDDIVEWFTTAYEFVVGILALIGYSVTYAISYLIAFVIGALTAAIGLFVGLVVGVFTALFDLGASFMSDVILGGGSLVDWFLDIPKTLSRGFVNGFKSVFNSIIGIYNDFAEEMVFEIPDWVPGIGGDEWKLPLIPELAKGGIVNGPTLAMIGEDGPEAVVPLNRKNNPNGIGLGGGGATTININVGGVTDRTDKRALAREIGDLIRAEMSRSGRSHGNRRSSV
tara:strand:+ start:7238 stop:8950 length:1713 start_codon:yes stop_codon:yes gene_type:complete